eukprot:COSAG02_NODE_75242_length_148_cov_16.673469_1_plen_28_part_10
MTTGLDALHARARRTLSLALTAWPAWPT